MYHALKRVVSAILVFTTKTTQPRPQVFSVNSALTCRRLYFWRHFLVKNKFFQIWSSVSSYGELCVCFSRGLRPGSKMCSEQMHNWQYLSPGDLNVEQMNFSPKVSLKVFLCVTVKLWSRGMSRDQKLN